MNDTLLSLIARCYGAIDRRRSLLILTLHRIGRTSKIGKDQLVRQLGYLARHYEVTVPSRLESVSHCKRVAMVTIDDCHSDSVETIYPVAASLGIPLTICVPTDFCFRNRWLWFDRFRWALRQAPPGRMVQLDGHQLVIGLESSEEAFSNTLKQKCPALRDEMIHRLLVELAITPPETPAEGFRPARLEDIKRLLDVGSIELCAHSVSHPVMTLLSNEELYREAAESKREIEAFCGKDVCAFCYPNGNFDDRTTRVLSDVGYRIAFTTLEGLNRPGRLNLMKLHRIHAHPGYGVFLKLASGLGDVQRRLGNRTFVVDQARGRVE